MSIRIDELRAAMFETLEKAKKAHRLNESGKKKLATFPLWKRIVFYSKFAKIRKKIKNHEMVRFACTSVSLHISRSIRSQERRLRQNARS
jgi:hypothetical protein